MMELQDKALPMFLLHIRGRQLPRGLICFFQSCVLKTNTREKKHIARLRQDGLEKKNSHKTWAVLFNSDKRNTLLYVVLHLELVEPRLHNVSPPPFFPEQVREPWLHIQHKHTPPTALSFCPASTTSITLTSAPIHTTQPQCIWPQQTPLISLYSSLPSSYHRIG